MRAFAGLLLLGCLAVSIAACATAAYAEAQASKLRWQDYEQLGYLTTRRAQFEATELALTNRLQAIIAEDTPRDSLVETYLERLVNVCALQEKDDTAVQYCKLALRFAEKLPISKKREAMLRSTLGKLYLRTGKLTLAELEYSRAIALLSQDGATSEELGKTRIGLADVLVKQGRFAEAEGLMRRALVAQSPLSSSPPALVSFARCLAVQGKNEEAEGLLKEALKVDREQLGEGQPALAADYNDLACVQAARLELEQAASSMQAALTICRRFHYPDLADWLANYRLVLEAQGKSEQAKKIKEEMRSAKAAAAAARNACPQAQSGSAANPLSLIKKPTL